MHKSVKSCFLPLSFLFLASPVFAKVELVPLVNANVVGGQYFFESEPASLGANVSVDAIPSIKFGDKLSLIPLVSFNYYGIKDVTELIGGGTLFQERQDLLGLAKLSFSPSEKLRLKADGSIKIERLKEAEGEIWGEGLFDYTKWQVGGEGELVAPVKTLESIRGGYKYYGISFNNYESLVAKYGDEFEELQQTPGARVLDYNVNEVFSDGSFTLSDRLLASYNFSLSMKGFPDQYLVDEAGSYTTDKRDDTATVYSGGLLGLLKETQKLKLTCGANVRLNTYNSTQNHYDVGRHKYIQDYYDYSEIRLAPTIGIYPQKPSVNVNISYSFAKRDYSARLVQDVDGNYGIDKIYILTNIVTGSVSYPVTKTVSLRAQINYLFKISNMKYEAVYRYNYTSMNCFGGVVLEF